MHRLISGIALMTVVASESAVAQSPDRAPAPFSFSLAAGPTRSFRGVDAPGVQGQGGVRYSLGRGFGAVLEGTGHWYETQPLYPCIIQDENGCYQTIRRALAAGTLSVAYHMSRFAADRGRTVPYLITGLGNYRSRRIATRYSDCQSVPGPCDRDIRTLEMRDSQFGWSGGVGVDSQLGRVGVFAETRLHYVYNNQPEWTLVE